MRIRQSSLGNFDSCPRRFQYSLETDTYFGGIVRAVGTAYHAGLEDYYRSLHPEDGWETTLAGIQDVARATLEHEIERSGDNFIWDDKFPDFDAADEAVGTMLMHYFEDGHVWPSDWTVLAVEQPFEFPLGEHTISSGGIDLVLQDTAGYVVGVDHKTAGRMWDQYKHHPRKNNQASLYVWALQQLYPDAPGHRFVFDIMTYQGKFERRISDPQQGHIEAVLDKATQIASLYTGLRANGLELPTNPSSTLCSDRYCDFFSICPSGSSLA